VYDGSLWSAPAWRRGHGLPLAFPTGSAHSPLALPRQPLVERGKIDHHALIDAAADLFGLVVRRDLEFDSLALNLDELDFGATSWPTGVPRPAPAYF
jgi:hypothetical protein